MPSALELVREVRGQIADPEGAEEIASFRQAADEVVAKLDAALAEMERDQPFIEAADAFTSWFFITDPTVKYAPEIQRLVAAYRKRREGMRP